MRNGSCVHCHTLYSDVNDSDHSQENTDLESEPDGYDSHDSFINDSEVEEEVGGEFYPEEDDLDFSDKSIVSDNESDTGRRRLTRRLRRQTNRGSSPRTRTVRRRRPPIVIDDSDSDVGQPVADDVDPRRVANEARSGSSSDTDASGGKKSRVLNDDSEGGDEASVVIRSKSQARRVLLVLDDEDDDSDESKGGPSRSKGDVKSGSSKGGPSRISRKGEDKGAASSHGSAVALSSATGRNKKRAHESDSDEGDTSDSDFVTTPRRRSKKARRGLEELFA